MVQCPFYPEDPAGDLKCDYLVGKDPNFKTGYIKEFCKGRFKDCGYYFHLTKWLNRIDDAMEEDDEDA